MFMLNRAYYNYITGRAGVKICFTLQPYISDMALFVTEITTIAR